jgi:hypothetical protein
VAAPGPQGMRLARRTNQLFNGSARRIFREGLIGPAAAH